MVLRLYLCKRLYSTPRAVGFMSWSRAYRFLSPRIRRPSASFRSSLATSKDRWWTLRVDHIHFKPVYHFALPSLLKKGERRTSEGCTNETGEAQPDKPPRLSCLKLALGSVLDCVASLRRDVARPILVLYVDRLVSGTAAERPRPARGVRLPGGPGGVFVPVSRECYPARRRRVGSLERERCRSTLRATSATVYCHRAHGTVLVDPYVPGSRSDRRVASLIGRLGGVGVGAVADTAERLGPGAACASIDGYTPWGCTIEYLDHGAGLGRPESTTVP